ncbi:hypothetical protein [Parasulfitobacter algicola]|uniref:Glycosyl transferase family 1 domain-containing protein n=1 Tax=Parasulfitobacter algicola TaxID=2614809 RepID=A0ABX2IX23_9RHOB|nr:hypothetical protein [Sulfitobacter algicola]NSX54698.1 hypothetical protein [Sulfitobacter algicola]
MANACLIVQTVSMGYIRNIVTFIHDSIKQSFGADAPLFLVNEIDQASYPPDSAVFVIGESFQRHTRRDGCRYIYLNFSVLRVMGNPLMTGRQGWKAVQRKKALLADKLDLYDMLLDYLPPQTRILQRQLDLPVRSFKPCIDPAAMPQALPLQERLYDVCFVGKPTKRRSEITMALQEKGLKLSPQTDVVFEEMAAQSKCCLNFHAERSNHLETPRIVGALAAQCPVVTENSYGLRDLLPPHLILQARKSALPGVVAALLQDKRRLQDLCNASHKWFRDTYLPQARSEWRNLCQEIIKLDIDTTHLTSLRNVS